MTEFWFLPELFLFKPSSFLSLQPSTYIPSQHFNYISTLANKHKWFISTGSAQDLAANRWKSVSFPSGLSFYACEDLRYNLHGCHNPSLCLTMRFTGYHVKLTQPLKNVQVQILMTRPTETREKTKKRGIKTCLQDPTERRGETQKWVYW